MKKIGKYRIRGILGRGGMGKVFKVEIPVIGKIAALKFLDPNEHLVDLIGWDQIRRIFITEAVTMANLRHPRLLEIWNFDETDGHPFYLMDYHADNLGTLIGESYQTERPSRVIGLDRAIHYTRQTLHGLAALHYAGIIHRDIKPFNILVTENNDIKICDFGLSKLRGERFEGPPHLKVGSPWYAAPEQEADPDGVDFRADLFSVGIMFYRMLTGCLPEPGSAPAIRANPDLDSEWDLFIARAIASDKAERFKSAKEMLAELELRASAWEAQKEKACSFVNVPEQPLQDSGSPFSAVKRRTEPIKICPRKAPQTFSVDPLWRPLTYSATDFTLLSEKVILDSQSSLIWEQSGSEYPLPWNRTADHIDTLNQNKLAGHQNWRLPTIDELMTLLTPPPQGDDFCIKPLFDRTQKRLWSCDLRSFTAAWYVNLELGFVGWQDKTAAYYVRGVCRKEAP